MIKQGVENCADGLKRLDPGLLKNDYTGTVLTEKKSRLSQKIKNEHFYLL